MAKDTTEAVTETFPGATVSTRRYEVVHETPQQIKLAVGRGFEGLYIGTEHIHVEASDTDDGKAMDFEQYEFQGDDGSRYVLNGSYQLDNAMRKVAAGSFVRITRLQPIAIRGGKQEMNGYRVEVAQ